MAVTFVFEPYVHSDHHIVLIKKFNKVCISSSCSYFCKGRPVSWLPKYKEKSYKILYLDSLLSWMADCMPNYELYQHLHSLRGKKSKNETLCVWAHETVVLISIVDKLKYDLRFFFVDYLPFQLLRSFSLFVWKKVESQMLHGSHPRTICTPVVAVLTVGLYAKVCMPICVCVRVCANLWLYVFLSFCFILPHPSLFDGTHWPQLPWQPGNHGSCLWHSWLRLIGFAGGFLPGHL